MTEKMKPSGIAWIGDIPTGWQVKKIKYFTEIVNGSTPDSSDLNCWDGPIKWITPADMANTGIIFEGERTLTQYGYNSCGTTMLPKGSIVISSRAPIGKINITGDALCTNQGCKSLVGGTDNRYLYYLLLSGQEELVRLGRGTTFIELSTHDLANFGIVLPGGAEQIAIADFLDTQCAKIDGVIADIEKQIETLQKYKKSLITETVTKGLDRSVPMKDSGIEWIGEIPAHWKVIRITKYLDSLVDYRGKTPEKVDDGVFLVTARNIKNGVVDYSLSQEYVAVEEYEQIMHRGKPEIGDVLFTTEAPLGEVANVDRTDIALAQRVIKFRGRKGCIDNYYLKYWLMSLGFQSFLWSLATGSTALGIAASKLGQLKMVLPPIDEQKKIVEKLDNKCINIDSIIAEKRKQLEIVQQHKKSLIYEYVTGKKRVTEVN